MDAKEIYERAQRHVDEIEPLIKEFDFSPKKPPSKPNEYVLRTLRMQSLMIRELARMLKTGD